MTREETEEFIIKKLNEIGSVLPRGCVIQLCASWPEGPNTESCNFGLGNWYARIGMARAFMLRDMSQELATHLKPEPPEDDGEYWKRS